MCLIFIRYFSQVLCPHFLFFVKWDEDKSFKHEFLVLIVWLKEPCWFNIYTCGQDESIESPSVPSWTSNYSRQCTVAVQSLLSLYPDRHGPSLGQSQRGWFMSAWWNCQLAQCCCYNYWINISLSTGEIRSYTVSIVTAGKALENLLK